MLIENCAISKKLFVTPHAESRFKERSNQDDLTDRLRRAIPFGGQLGDDLLLIDGDLVFAIDQKDSVVLTCLTKDQAIANMQAARPKIFSPNGRPPSRPKESKPKEPKPTPPPTTEFEKLRREVVRLNRERCLMKTAMDEVLTPAQVKAVRARLTGLKLECREITT